MARKCYSFMVNHWIFMTLVYINTLGGSTSKVLSVTHSSDEGDSFEVYSKNYSVCQTSCQGFEGFLHETNLGDSSNGHKCSCYCADSTKPTFYRTKTGQQSCVKDKEILADRNGDICDFYTDNAQQLQVLNLHVSGKARMKPDGFCENVQVSGWQFYYNSSWTSSSFDTFSSNIVGKNGAGKNTVRTFLTWNGNLTPFYKGLLIKVIVRCTYGGKTDDRCVMLKAQGTHFYHEVPTATSPVMPGSLPDKGPAPSVLSRQGDEMNKKKSDPETVSVASASLPTEDYTKARTRKIWLTASLGLSVLPLIIVGVIIGFLVVKCRRNCRKPERSISRRPLQVSSEHSEHAHPTSEENAAMHDYEYVHYPCLVDGGSTGSTDKRKCERSNDNKLIIWSKNSSAIPTQTNQSTQSTPPRLPYQRLLSRTTSKPPDGNVGAPVSSPTVGVGEEFPYQKLIKTVPSTESKEQQGSDNAEKVAADVPLYDETAQKPYQSLSLKRNPVSSPKESDTGYMLMEGAPRPESIYEYDYTEPLEPNTLFRISHDETKHVPVEISIGDLSVVTLNQQQLQQQQQKSREVILSVVYIDENYEDIENIKVKNGLPTKGNDDGRWQSENKSSAVSYENLSGEHPGHLSERRTVPDEYVEMGKRRSVLVVDNPDLTDQSGCNGFPNIEEEGPEYHVLEGMGTKDYDGNDDDDDDDDDDDGDDDDDDGGDDDDDDDDVD